MNMVGREYFVLFGAKIQDQLTAPDCFEGDAVAFDGDSIGPAGLGF